MSSNGNEEAREGWQSLLTTYGWTGTEARLEELCNFLVEEGVTWRMLGRMGDPTRVGAAIYSKRSSGISSHGQDKPTFSADVFFT